ncbi:MAG: TlpA disulfide reductase family protein [Flavobacteriales bacterium]
MPLRCFGPLVGLVLLFSACRHGAEGPPVPRSGPWRMVFTLRDTIAGTDHQLPFLFDLDHNSSSWRMHIHNGAEDIAVDEITLRGDSLRIRMPLYDSEFIGVVRNDSTITGDWHNYLKGPNYRIPFTASAGAAPRFTKAPAPGRLAADHWEAYFGADSTNRHAAIGLFTEINGRVTGTFATETGDHHFLDGMVSSDSLYLSSFNGSQALLFAAALRGDSLIGRCWSGIHYQEPWVAHPNPSFALRSADSLTFLRKGHAMVDLRFPDVEGGQVSLKAPEHRNKVVLVQIMGSWCGNCVDETLLLNELYARHHQEGLDILGIAFERQTDSLKAVDALKRFRKRLGVAYPIAYAGTADKHTGEKLPFLDHFMGYPTCIFIGRDGVVRRIHTGFYGPGTGEERYAAYKRDLKRSIIALLAEGTPALVNTSR